MAKLESSNKSAFLLALHGGIATNTMDEYLWSVQRRRLNVHVSPWVENELDLAANSPLGLSIDNVEGNRMYITKN